MYTAAVITALLALSGSTMGRSIHRRQQSTAAPNAYMVMAIHSASPIHYLMMEARGTNIYLGGEPATYCPDTVTQQGGTCPAGNMTVFSGDCGLSVEVPGGQQLYVAPDGSLDYSVAHTAVTDPAFVTCPFNFTATPDSVFNGTITTTAYGATGFMACPTNSSDLAWQVFADISDAVVPTNISDCIGFEAEVLALSWPAGEYGAWEYT